MTLVVYRDGIIAADMATWHGSHRSSTTQKISRHPSGILLGAAGDTWVCKNFLGMALAIEPEGLKPNMGTDAGGMMARPDGSIFIFEGDRGKFRVEDAYFALGSGAAVALGALDAGVDAMVAVRIACERHEALGYPIQAMHHDGRHWRIEHAYAPVVQQVVPVIAEAIE
jgi:hypothetical protein